VDIKKIVKLISDKVPKILKTYEYMLIFYQDGFNFVIKIDEDDDKIIRFFIPNFIDLDGFEVDGINLAYRTTKNVKSAKIIIIDNKAWSTIEGFYNDEESFVLVFDKCRSALIASVVYFREEASKAKVDKTHNEKAYV
jgi:hypothetical protein